MISKNSWLRILPVVISCTFLMSAPVGASHPCSPGQECLPHPVPEPQVINAPEPGTLVLMAAGLAGLGLHRRIGRDGS